ncbi:MAG: hypothetical protein A3K19_32135 [Lentisphaerae bacterium RIFOXYB12_FULL_65_16]|nr:MAG: hypothetical protein A3K18_10915 [Lentisphaerae bacterium RIFOXYA12_64_32]OGV88751.1 MAG: hypothetical protein A3K19_32135 [Lentisphaerae bacterium RIFOXYB12_FULL_65_16]
MLDAWQYGGTMPEIFKPLFNPSLLKGRMAGYAPEFTDQQRAAAADWAKTAADPAFLDLNEKPLQRPFLADIFGRLLGYLPVAGHLDAYHLKAESASSETKGGRTPGGRLGFITSGTFANANFAAPFRAWLPTVARYRTLVNFGENQPFADAEMVFPTISILEKAATPQPFRAYFMRGAIPDSLADAVATEGIDCDASVFARAEWRFQPAAVSALFDRIMAVGRPLDEVVGGRMYRGVLTGLNEAFIVDQATRDRLVAADPGCAPLLRRMLRGEDLRPWYQEDEGRWLIFTRRGVDIDRFPSIKAYLETFRSQLEPKPTDWTGVDASGRRIEWPGRKSGSYKWYEIQDSVDYYAVFDEPKILWPDIAKRPRFSWDTDGVYVNDTAFVMPCEKWLLSVLASRVTWFCVSQLSTPLRLRGGLWQSRCKGQFMGRLPIVVPDASDRERLAALATDATAVARERYALHERVRHRLLTDFCSPAVSGQSPAFTRKPEGASATDSVSLAPATAVRPALNTRLTDWWALDFAAFRSELRKALKATIPVSERQEWEDALAGWKQNHATLTARLVAIETEIDERVYHLFGLAPADVKLLAEHAHQAMIDYPYGAV